MAILDLRARKDDLANAYAADTDGEAGAATVMPASAFSSPEFTDSPRRQTFTARDRPRILAETCPRFKPAPANHPIAGKRFSADRLPGAQSAIPPSIVRLEPVM